MVGLGTGWDGWVQIFDDATTGYAPMPGTPVAGGWLQVQWPGYDASNGATHPAVGDFDGDGMAEIAVGLGTGSFGWIQVFDDQAHGFAPMTEVSHGWIAPSWPSYDSANGDSYLAACDLDGDGKAELVVGLGTGSSGSGPDPRRCDDWVRPAIRPRRQLDPNQLGRLQRQQRHHPSELRRRQRRR